MHGPACNGNSTHGRTLPPLLVNLPSIDDNFESHLNCQTERTMSSWDHTSTGKFMREEDPLLSMLGSKQQRVE